MKNNLQIETKDLNAIDMMNGKGSVSSKSGIVVSDKGENLKGALAKYNGSFSLYTELMFIKGVRKQITEYELERFDYQGLPDDVDKYRLETKPVENGSGVFIKYKDQFFMCNYTTKTFNMYNEPRIIIINEPKSKVLNGLEFDVEVDEAVIYRNNKDKVTNYQQAYRFISNMERNLYMIEQNITKSAPKGIINLKGSEFDENGENPMMDSMEQIVNGQRTFFTIKSKAIEDASVSDDNPDDIFIPIEFTDKTDSLLKSYSFFKEQIKEIIGAMSNTSDKKDRLVTGEVDAQQPIANSARQHSFNIRKIDIEKINEKFTLSISIEYQSDEREDEENQEDDNNQEGGDKDE